MLTISRVPKNLARIKEINEQHLANLTAGNNQTNIADICVVYWIYSRKQIQWIRAAIVTYYWRGAELENIRKIP
jgi:hypothetical protein